eukprot:TRINITY_DN2499_c0_g1_i1.p1 TRINITY_DN2499_c0_g1~~TRINITY_DN2499_c0_g1_i1.p1  ORF type:complete len:349 (+),score=67.06 TRINITY_DN2499_c0_g1_i1:951-1997(+)
MSQIAVPATYRVVRKRSESSRAEQIAFAVEESDEGERAVVKTYPIGPGGVPAQMDEPSQVICSIPDACIPNFFLSHHPDETVLTFPVKSTSPESSGIVSKWSGELSAMRLQKILKSLKTVKDRGFIKYINIFQLRDLILVDELDNVEMCCLSLLNTAAGADDWTHIPRLDLLYLPPEALVPNTKESSLSADDKKELQVVYALGSVLYELLSGSKLIDLSASVPPMVVLQKIVSGKVELLRESQEDTSEIASLKVIVNSMLHRDPTQRPTFEVLLRNDLFQQFDAPSDQKHQDKSEPSPNQPALLPASNQVPAPTDEHPPHRVPEPTQASTASQLMNAIGTYFYSWFNT